MDLIKREDAIRAINETPFLRRPILKPLIKAKIERIPSAEPKQGEWISVGAYEVCKDCREVKRFPHWSFCPNCGARMKGADDA